MKRVKRKADSICERAGKGGRGRGGRSTENPPGPRAGDGGWASLMIGAPWTRRLESQAEGRTVARRRRGAGRGMGQNVPLTHRSEEHTSELQSLMRSSYAVCCLKKKKKSK